MPYGLSLQYSYLLHFNPIQTIPRLSVGLWFVSQAVVGTPQYPQFLQDSMRVFVKLLLEGEPQFIAEQNSQVNSIFMFSLNIVSEAYIL